MCCLASLINPCITPKALGWQILPPGLSATLLLAAVDGLNLRRCAGQRSFGMHDCITIKDRCETAISLLGSSTCRMLGLGLHLKAYAGLLWGLGGFRKVLAMGVYMFEGYRVWAKLMQ